MGVNVLSTFDEAVATYFFLTVAFLMTAIAFVPDRTALRPADEAAAAAPRLWLEPARQSGWCGGDLRRELPLDAPHRLVRDLVRGDPAASRAPGPELPPAACVVGVRRW